MQDHVNPNEMSWKWVIKLLICFSTSMLFEHINSEQCQHMPNFAITDSCSRFSFVLHTAYLPLLISKVILHVLFVLRCREPCLTYACGWLDRREDFEGGEKSTNITLLHNVASGKTPQALLLGLTAPRSMQGFLCFCGLDPATSP